MKLPERVKVGYKTYQIEPNTERDAQSNGHYGYAIHDQARIVSQAYGHPYECANTLLHEILHCCCSVGHIGLEDEDEERVVTIMANTLISAMQNNPDVFRWILSQAGK